MLLLPLLTGLSLVLHGTSSYAVGARDRNYHLSKYSDIIRRLTEYSARLQEEKRKQDSLLQNTRDFDHEINLAAASRDLGTKSDGNGDTNGLPAADPPKADPPTTTTVKGEPEVHEPPEPPQRHTASRDEDSLLQLKKDDVVFTAVVTACSVAGFVGLIMAGVCWYKLHRRVKAATDVDYPAYGVTGPTKERLPSPGDRKLAQSAQMYHYQHQKQQMIAMEKANGEMKQDGSEDESEEENEEGDYTVYECPGLAPTGEMEVRNPLFTEDAQTPVNGQGPAVNGLPDDATDAQE